MSTDLTGKRINGFELIRVIGRGGMGVVYKAHEMTLQRVVALKVLPSHLAENKEFIQRFYREARAAAQLNHPNVVTIHRVGEDDGHHYIAMEYLKGREVTEVIKEKEQLEPREALMILRQVAAALAAAHDLKILHRDIKPQNIMIDDAGRVKVMDFGIARLSEAHGGGHGLTMTGQILGTPAYMSPEQCTGEASDHRSDIFSLGVVFYQMLAGRVPFQGDTPLAVIRKIVDDPLPSIYNFKQDIPDDVVKILHRMLAKNPAHRYNDAHELESDIRAVLDGVPTSKATSEMATITDASRERPNQAFHAAPTEQFTRPVGGAAAPAAPKSRGGAAAAAILLLLAAGALGGFLYLRGGAAGPSPDSGDAASAPVPPSGGASWPSANAGPRAMIPEEEPEEIPVPAEPSPAPAEPSPQPPPAAPPSAPEPPANRAPSAEVTVSPAKSVEGEPVTFAFKASDPDEDPVELACRFDGKAWFKVEPAQEKLTQAGFSPGEHTVEFRVTDPKGERAVAKKTFIVSAKPKAETPKPAPPPAPSKPEPKPEPEPVRPAAPAEPATPAPPKPQPPRPAPVQRPSAEPLTLGGAHSGGVMAVAASPSGGRAVSGGQDGVAAIWNLSGGSAPVKLEGHKGTISSAAISPDGSLAATAGWDSTVRVWDAATGAPVLVFEAHKPSKVIAAGFSADGLALSADDSGLTILWDARSGGERKRFPMGKVNCVAFSANGRFAVSGSQEPEIRVWDVQAGAPLAVLESKSRRATLAVALSPDGGQALSGGQDKMVRLWSVGEAKEIRVFEGHENWVYSVAFSPDGRLAASGGKDNAVRIWDLETGSEIQAFRGHTGSVFCVAFTPDSKSVVSSSADKSVMVHPVAD